MMLKINQNREVLSSNNKKSKILPENIKFEMNLAKFSQDLHPTPSPHPKCQVKYIFIWFL